jgi:hypothetical protein
VKSFTDFLQRRIDKLRITTKTLNCSTTPSNKDVFGDTVLEKSILAAASAFSSILFGYVFICLFKCVRNNGHLKVRSLMILTKIKYLLFYSETGSFQK